MIGTFVARLCRRAYPKLLAGLAVVAMGAFGASADAAAIETAEAAKRAAIQHRCADRFAQRRATIRSDVGAIKKLAQAEKSCASTGSAAYPDVRSPDIP